MKKRGKDALRWVLAIGLIICGAQASTPPALAFGVGPSHAGRSFGRLRQRDDSQDRVSCEDALKNAPAVKVGMRASEVLALLGEPSGRVGDEWGYNFWACVSPPRVGEQKIIGLGIVFTEGVVKEIKYATIDATGPAPNSTPTQKREKKRRPKSRKRAAY
jgi:hypothetical protein